eukprot:COSAG06_NODE_6923_length_2713_cov_795.381790_2_plen_53_part_00
MLFHAILAAQGANQYAAIFAIPFPDSRKTIICQDRPRDTHSTDWAEEDLNKN